MATVVMKFGGTSVATTNFIKNAAKKIAATYRKGNQIIVVVSAMGQTTDRLISLARTITRLPSKRELDMLMTSGERISTSLLSIALHDLGIPAISFTGSQVGIITDDRHTDARIIEIKGDRIREALSRGNVPIIAGFQGVSLGREITTLGRGGSDTTAVACAKAFKASCCEIYTDVEGVYSEDPRLFANAKIVDRITYDEMLELSTQGSQILAPRACTIAARYKIPIVIKSSFLKSRGTKIIEGEKMEKPFVRAITHDFKLYMVILESVPRNPKALSQIITNLARAGVRLKFFFHGISEAERFDLSFIVPKENSTRAIEVLTKTAKKLKAKRLRVKKSIASLTLVGPGIGPSIDILTKLFDTLSKARIHIEAVTTSTISISCFLTEKKAKPAIRYLLAGFKLVK